MVTAQHKYSGDIATFSDTEWNTVSKTGYYTLITTTINTTTARGAQPTEIKTTAKKSGCNCGKKR